jgi:hypothetical protein
MVRFQKLTRNLFLTLHGHNVHLQQRQLSKFLMRYQQFASHAYCGAAGPVYKMASQQEKDFCVLRFEVSRSVITVQREFCARFRTAGSACTIIFLYTLYIDRSTFKSERQCVSVTYVLTVYSNQFLSTARFNTALLKLKCYSHWLLNPLTPNGHYSGRTAPLTYKRSILNIYSTNIHTEYFKHAA